jgi:hypothetical protein
MNKIFSSLLCIFALTAVSQVKAQTFRTYTTTSDEISFTNRVISDGRSIVEVVITTVVVDLTPNPTLAVSVVSTDTKTEKIFLTPAAAAVLQAAVNNASSGTSIATTVAAEVDDSDKIKDANGAVQNSVTFVEIINGVPTFTNANNTTVNVNDVITSERADFTTIVETTKAIVSQN